MRSLHVFVNVGRKSTGTPVEGSKTVVEKLTEDVAYGSDESDGNPEDKDEADGSDEVLGNSDDDDSVEANANLNDDEMFDYIENYVMPNEKEGDEEALSEYAESDGEVYTSNTEEEGEPVKIKRPRIVYDPKCRHKDLKIELGMRFESGYQCRKALRTWAIENEKFIHFKRVSVVQCEAVCVEGYKWRVCASIVREDKSFKVKTYVGVHTCPTALSNKLLTSEWIANRYLEIFRANMNWSVKELKGDIMRMFKVSVPKDRLYKAGNIARELVRGTLEEHYASLTKYLAELKRVDNEGTFELLISEDNVFRGLYLGHSPLIKGFKKSCRPIVSLDGCFLKTYLGEILLDAVRKDGNNKMFLIAWACVEIENEVCWRWFLKHLFKDLEITHGAGWTFISDQQKGLENAVHNLAPRAEHRNCAKHVYMNWKKNGHKGATLKNLLWTTVRCIQLEDYKAVVLEIKKESFDAYQDFISRDVSRFCKAFILIDPVSDIIDNNISETFHGYILKAKGKHIIHMCEEIRKSLMVRQVKKKDEMSTVTSRICPLILKKLEVVKVSSNNCASLPTLGNKFEVVINGKQYVVSVRDMTYSCRLWDLTCIPCKHDCSTIMYMNEDPSNYVHDYYSVGRYLGAYEFGLEPITSEKYWPEVTDPSIKPPTIPKNAGRPKKNMKRDPNEGDLKNPNKLRRMGEGTTCWHYGQEGHNINTCQNETMILPPARKRCRPRKNPAPTIETTDGQSRLVGRAKMTPEQRMPASRKVTDVQNAFKAYRPPRKTKAKASSSKANEGDEPAQDS
ncbi:uncharacterized protein LOC130990435 [Salvia miltiorrhiza]|uniref:uncharacterized protein LOC130990435 n=1 Tax=Salvia miltiorrhiza TaxID=226208 RepID=UPI0025ACE598|nr:uncharacterized protein LOC130990435 [Salvia miltiorrhiza]